MKYSEPKLKLAVFAAMMILCCSTMFVSTSVRAQLLAQLPCPSCPCPPVPLDDAQYDTTPVPWNGADTCVDLYGDSSCLVHICYICRQTSSNNYDYGITKICWNPDCGTDSLTLLHDATWWLMQHNPCNFPSDTCPCSGPCNICHGNNIQWSENFPSCWTIGFTPTGGKYLEMCPKHGWCVNAYWVCIDPITHQRKLCPYRSVQTTWQCDKQPSGPNEGCQRYDCPPVQ